MNSVLDIARNLRSEGQTTKDRNLALRNFIAAAKLYLKEIDNVQDHRFQAALVFLAKSSMYDSLGICDSLQSGRSLPSEKENSSLLLYHQRVIEAVQQQRLSGLQRLPQGSEPSANQVLKDIQTMEKKLSELGLRKPQSSKSANEQAKRALSNIASTLGESFLDLRNDEKQRDTSELDYSMIALPTVDTQHLPLHQRNQQQRVHPPPIPIPSPQPYPSSMIPFWPSSNQPTHPEVNSVDHKPPIHKHADRYQSAIDGLDWNTQSFMTNAPSHPSATEANSLTTSVASSSAGDENAALRRRSGSNETAVSRLLDTIAKLKEENRRLSSQNQQVQQEMQSFRHEYEEKLREVKHLIQSGHQNRTAAALSSSEIEGISKLNEALEVALRREKKYQQRHADLEKLVIGLTKKYDTLKEDSQRKDALIQKLQCTPQSSTSGDSVHSTHVQREASIPTGPTMQSPSVLSSSSVGIAGPLSPGNNNSRNPMSASGNLLPYGRRPATTAKHPAAVTLESLQKSTKHVK